MPSEVEIGVWVEGTQKWVTGVSKRTSCHDIIKALLRAQNQSALDAEVNKFVIVEKWRKMERPLDHEQRILKVWKTWGEAIQEVRFSLRRVKGDDGDKSDSDTGSRVERSRRRHKWRQANSAHSKGHVSSTAGHISTSALAGKKAPEDDATVSDTMERLMRLVVAQGETIQTQLRRMHERDQQIEDFEHQLHFLRVQSLGSDYLLHSYLQEPLQDRNSSSSQQDSNSFSKDDVPCEEKSNDSGVVTEELSDPVSERPLRSSSRDRKGASSHGKKDTVEEVKAKTHLLDQLDDVLTKLLEQEEELARLEESLAETTTLQMSHLKAEIAMATKVHASAVTSSRQNELQLRELDTVLYQRRLALESLLEEDLQYEKEVIALQAHLDYIIHLPPTAFKLSDATQPPPPAPPSHPSSLGSGSALAPLSKGSGGGSLLNLPKSDKVTESSLSSSKISSQEVSSLKSILRTHPSPPPLPLIPPPLPSSSPPPLDDEDDDKDSGQTSSLCVSSSSSTSSESSPCQGSSAAKMAATKISKGAHPPPSHTHPPPSHKDTDSTDSNSDTGLSSLHSSSDEGAYVLNTLV